ncbi:hypothetical protein [Sciscionella sediminilitoris]|uniref:hypothetical protein n=1 Tax=Sciscionella sediminilitoris TaxID=1445613 RepID=UPI0004DFA77E|nr:hypothetical protein [Sciscionella sp. SE31]
MLDVLGLSAAFGGECGVDIGGDENVEAGPDGPNSACAGRRWQAVLGHASAASLFCSALAAPDNLDGANRLTLVGWISCYSNTLLNGPVSPHG